MITAHDILWGIVAPAVLACIAIVIGRFAQTGRREVAAWAVAVAIAGGFILAFIGISGKLSIPPVGAQEWLPLMAAGAVVVAIASMVARRWRWPALISMVLLIASAWLVTRPRQRSLDAHAYHQLLLIVVIAAVLWWLAMERLAMVRRGGTLPLLLSGVMGSAALVLVNGGTQQHGQIEGGVAVVLLVIAALSIWLRDLTLARGGILAIAVAGLGMLLCGYLFADVKWIDVAILAIAPLLAWAGELPGIRSRAPFVRFAICAVLVLGVCAISFVPAARGIRQTMKEQAESTLY